MKIQRFYFLFVLAVACVLPGAKAQNKSAVDYYRQGVLLGKSKPAASFDQFIKVVEIAGEANPDLRFAALLKLDSVAYFDLGGRWADTGLALLRANLTRLARYHGNDRVAAELYYLGGLWLKARVVIPDSSIYCFEQSLRLWTTLGGPRSEKVADCCHGLGDVYKYYLFDFDTAEAYYERALDIRESLADVDPVSLAANYYSLATVNRSQRDFQKALLYGFRAIEAVNRLNNPEFSDRTYVIVGNIYRDMNNYDSAIRLYNTAIASNKKNYHGKPNETLANFYSGLGEILSNQSAWSQALVNYEQAASVFDKVKVKDRLLFIHLQLQMCEAYLSTNQEARASEHLLRARQEVESMNLAKSGSAAELYNWLGRLDMLRGNTDSALIHFQRSLIASTRSFSSMNWKDNPELSSVELGVFTYQALLYKANVLMIQFKKSGDVLSARTVLNCYRLAEQVLSNARGRLDTEDAKWAYLDSNFELYEKGIDAAFQFYNRSKADSLLGIAYHYFEGSKSRSLSDALHLAESVHSIEDSLFVIRNNLKSAFFHVQDQLAGSDRSKEGSWRAKLVDLDKKIRATEGAIKRKYPSYLETEQEFNLSSIAEVQHYAAREKGLVLEYFWGNENVYAFGITSERAVFRRVGTVDSLSNQIQSLVATFDVERSVMDPDGYRSFTSASWFLYQKLVGAFSDLDKNRFRMTVVPDGLINQLPFEVLIRNRPNPSRINFKSLPYLVLDRVIDYAFSMSILIHKTEPSIKEPSLLAFGLTGTGFRYGAVQDDTGAAGQELEALAKYFPSGKFFLGNQATKEGFTHLAPDFDLIHLAIHGRGDPNKNYAATLYFKGDSLNDGELRWYELYSVRLKATLAVLSSCESGIGKAYRGEGMLSMANAFAYAGCKNIVLGLWKVNDRVSVTLMTKFYEGLLAGQGIDEALTGAKRSYLAHADELTAHPKLWGALVAYGSQHVVKKNKGEWIVALALGFIIVATFAAFRGRRRLS